MPRAKLPAGIDLEYETFGDEAAPLLVLVMGFSMQMIAWDTAFCEALAARGFRVVRFDNRDVGRSTKLEHLGFPDFARAMGGDRAAAAYSIEDMAGDLVGLIDALGAKAAHIVGASMGGFIVQETAIHHPERVLSVASIMSGTGDRSVGQARPEALAALLSPPPPDRDAAVEHALGVWRVIGSPGFPFDEGRMRRRVGAAWDRDHDPIGVARQATAIFTQRDRTADLARVRAPAVVIHGADDPLVTLSGGEATARAIPGARMVIVPGMGHDLAEGAWPIIVDAIVDNARRAGA
ncbi:MAG TPA: alpha/beta hydrolase [Polyangiaceae bacterium]|jgi:pimeloyl-ACP methyl ester carboxylesterase